MKAHIRTSIVIFVAIATVAMVVFGSLKLVRLNKELQGLKECLAQKEAELVELNRELGETRESLVQKEKALEEYLEKKRDLERAFHAKETTIEKVYNFPEEYAGQVLVFEGARLNGDIGKRKEFFLLSVRSKKGKIVASWLGSSSGFAFVTSLDIGSKLLEMGLEANCNYTVRLTCKVKKMYEEYWVADVFRIDFYAEGSGIYKTITETGVE